jgi:hypothetical protein
MQFVNIYFAGFLVLACGAMLALWKAGVLEQVSAGWIAIGSVIVVGLGVMMAVSAGKPGITKP